MLSLARKGLPRFENSARFFGFFPNQPPFFGVKAKNASLRLADHLFGYFGLRQVRVQFERRLEGRLAARPITALGVGHGQVVLRNRASFLRRGLFQVRPRLVIESLAV